MDRPPPAWNARLPGTPHAPKGLQDRCSDSVCPSKARGVLEFGTSRPSARPSPPAPLPQILAAYTAQKHTAIHARAGQKSSLALVRPPPYPSRMTDRASTVPPLPPRPQALLTSV